MENKEITKNNLKLVDELLEKMKTMNEDEFMTHMKKASLFWNYSYTNRIILAFHGAENVKGFRSWQDIGRKVKKGSKAIWILAPITYASKKTVETESGQKEVEEIFAVSYKSVPVFDLKDTEGKELPTYRTIKADHIDFNDLVKVAESFNFSTEKLELRYSTGGSINVFNKIKLNTLHSENENKKTLIHEISHGLLGHLDDQSLCRDVKEHEAETTAYLICKALEIDIDFYSACYLKSWQMNADIKKSMKKINQAFSDFMTAYMKIKKSSE